MMYAKVFVPNYLFQGLWYLVPEELESQVLLGLLIHVPLGKNNHSTKAIIWELLPSSSPNIPKDLQALIEKEVLKPIIGLTSTSPFWHIPIKERIFFEFVANYYLYPLGSFLFETLPLSFSDQSDQAQELPSPVPSSGSIEPLATLNEEQSQAYHSLKELLKISSPPTFKKALLHGITGSGKTWVYMSLIQDVLAQGYSVQILLPEINLTPQLIDFFKSHFSSPIYLYHSGISKKKRQSLMVSLWNGSLGCALKGPCLLLGVRSSVFFTPPKLGLIIVDEEHETTYKQTQHCPYSAKEMAIKKASLWNIPLLLCSATPSLESYYLAQQEKNLVTLFTRANKSTPPQWEILTPPKTKEIHWPLPEKCLEEIQFLIQEKGEQVLIFINRLGHFMGVVCHYCGHHYACPNCSVSLKYFKRKGLLRCLYCNFQQKSPSECDKCGNTKFQGKSFGIEAVVEALQKKFPNFSIARFDREELQTLNSIEKILKQFHEKKIDILVGTQMLTKGHNFKRVNHVYILGVDFQLTLPDFRSLERAYQQLAQIGGRAGRFSQEGKVHLISHMHHHPIFGFLQSPYPERFYQFELPLRKLYQFPPFGRLISLCFHHSNSTTCQKIIAEISFSLVSQGFKVIGPREALIERKNKHHYQVLLIQYDSKKDFIASYPLLYRLQEQYPSLKIDVGAEILR